MGRTMNGKIEIKTTDDDLLLGRLDNRPSTATNREQAGRLAAVQEPSSPAVDEIIDNRTVAVLIDSTILGGLIWFALRDAWKPDDPNDDTPIFYASELPFLRQKTPEQLRSIFNVKRAFTVVERGIIGDTRVRK